MSKPSISAKRFKHNLKLKDFVIVTSNKDKLAEINEILGTDHGVSEVDIPEVQSLDIDQVITAKAKSAFKIIKKPVLVEDISLEIKALNGLPGPFVKFFLATLGTEGTVRLIGKKSTETKVTAAVALYNGLNLKIFKGVVWGTLSKKNKGAGGFGFDKVFIPKGYSKTYAEIPSQLKNRISHRAKALSKLRKFLEE